MNDRSFKSYLGLIAAFSAIIVSPSVREVAGNVSTQRDVNAAQTSGTTPRRYSRRSAAALT